MLTQEERAAMRQRLDDANTAFHERWDLLDEVKRLRTELTDIHAATRGWKETNKRRGELIQGEVKGTLGPEETEELARLQRIADLRTDLLDPLEMKVLEQIRDEIVRNDP